VIFGDIECGSRFEFKRFPNVFWNHHLKFGDKVVRDIDRSQLCKTVILSIFDVKASDGSEN
jgi:hypothetical protein